MLPAMNSFKIVTVLSLLLRSLFDRAVYLINSYTCIIYFKNHSISCEQKSLYSMSDLQYLCLIVLLFGMIYPINLLLFVSGNLNSFFYGFRCIDKVTFQFNFIDIYYLHTINFKWKSTIFKCINTETGRTQYASLEYSFFDYKTSNQNVLHNKIFVY